MIANNDDSDNISVGNNVQNAYTLLEQHCENNPFALVNCIRCAAHTLQLAVFDVLKAAPIKINVDKCHKLAVALRKQLNLTKVIDSGYRQPILNMPTRWSSTYNMIERLVQLKVFCYDNADQPELNVDEMLWNFMNDFLLMFKPVTIATAQLQEREMGYGDFYKVWLRLRMEVNKITVNNIQFLKDAVKKREDLLINNDVFLAALYTDPRFNFILNTTQKIKAQSHIRQLANHFQTCLNQSEVLDNTDSLTSSNAPNISLELSNGVNDELSNYINNLADDMNGTVASSAIKSIEDELIAFHPERSDHNMNVLTYWKLKSKDYPILAEIAQTIHTVPATQVTVERAFSSLKFIVSDCRNRISSDHLQSVLLVRLNHNFDVVP